MCSTMGEGFCGCCANPVMIAKKTRARITSVYFGECTAVSSAEIHENGGRRDSIAKLVIFERTANARGERLLYYYPSYSLRAATFLFSRPLSGRPANSRMPDSKAER